ncbi:MAG: pyridoxal phosphate enzyme (YggS family) [Porticoccus sp.]|jgi:pyridoxal phosphate enzyme (YggS family)
MPNIIDNLCRVHQQIDNAANKIGRHPRDITLLAVSKGQSSTAIREAYRQGQRHFGENYLQEALDKQQQLADLTDIHWHFIGPIQSNKTRKVAKSFDWVHSIDRMKIAERLSVYRSDNNAPLNICLQVNIDNEESKSGLHAHQVQNLAQAITKLPNLKLRGLMAIPESRQAISEQKKSFADLAKLLANLQSSSPQLSTLDTLSMGMSGDIEAAIIEGSTLIRVGNAIFGPRKHTR